MNVYVFGNEDVKEDKIAFKLAKDLKKVFPQIAFIKVSPNQDVPFENQENVLILDVVEGIKEPMIIEEKEIDRLIVNKGTTVHDYDLGFQIKYLKKLGKIGVVKILGIPMKSDATYDFSSIQSIFKKFVAQDMQGS